MLSIAADACGAGQSNLILSCFDDIERLELTSNNIFSTIPSELGLLSNLQVLGVGSNQLTGTIPASLGNIPNLGKSMTVVVVQHFPRKRGISSLRSFDISRTFSLQEFPVGNNSFGNRQPFAPANIVHGRDGFGWPHSKFRLPAQYPRVLERLSENAVHLLHHLLYG